LKDKGKGKDKDEEEGVQDKDGTYRCLTCEVVGTIKGNDISVTVRGLNWPLHRDCEWAKTIDDLDVEHLEKVG